MSDLVTLDAQKLKILDDGVLKLLLLLTGVGVVEYDNQLTLVGLGKVLVKKGSLSMSNVQVRTAARRETGDNSPSLASISSMSKESTGFLFLANLGSLALFGEMPCCKF